jgi:EpsI family protein
VQRHPLDDALSTLGVVVAVALRFGFWRGALLVFAALPAAMLGNLLRLVVTALLVTQIGPRATSVWLHETVGFAGFAASVALLAALVALLGGRGAASGTPPEDRRAAYAGRALAWLRTLRIVSPRSAWIALALLVLAGGYGTFLRTHAAEPRETPDLTGLPMAFGDWTGSDIGLDDRVLDKLNPESYVFRNYANAAGASLGLYVAYYRDPREGAQIHSPMHCYPGAGWRILESAPLPVRDLGGRVTRMQRLLVEKHGRTDVVLYWYDTRTGRLTSDLDLKFNLMRTALLHRPQDAAFVALVDAARPGEDVDTATARLLGAVADTYPALEAALPFGG